MASTPARPLGPGSQSTLSTLPLSTPHPPLPSPLHDQPQPIASGSKPHPHTSALGGGHHALPRNPQLGPEPFFAYPTPTPEEIEDELPPYWESENVPLGPILDRLARKGYEDLRILTQQTLPSSNARQKPRQIVEYAKTTRQLVLKYLAVLRWKTAVDVASSTALGSSLPSNASHPQQNSTITSFPTPHSNSNDDSNDTSPGASVSGVGKGKGKAAVDEGTGVVRGKVADARRLQQFLQHQNAQHEAAIEHVRHVTRLVETLRERNADLITALSLLSTGTYDNLPTELTEAFLPRPPLTASSILSTIQHLNSHLLYRLRCVDLVPPEMQVERVSNGRVYVSGSGAHGWKAELTVVGFDDDSRWWLTGVGWAWKAQSIASRDKAAAGDDGAAGEAEEEEKDAEGKGKRFSPEERQQILDMANIEILAPREVEKELEPARADGETGLVSAVTTPATKSDVVVVGAPAISRPVKTKLVDAPLVRVYNFMQHLSLSYQLEVLFSQSMRLSRGRWRGQLIVDIDRQKKQLRLRYWIRPRPEKPVVAQQAAVGKRPAQSSLAASRSPLVGGTLTFTIVESTKPLSEGEKLFRAATSSGMEATERVLKLEIAVKWEIGEAGVGGGLKVGDMLDTSSLRIDVSNISVEDVLGAVTRSHAAQLTRRATMALLASPRVALFTFDPPTIRETPESSTRPLAMYVPLPGRHQPTRADPSDSTTNTTVTSGAATSHLVISVSSLTGYFVIEDTGAKEGGAAASVVAVGTGLGMWMGMENGRAYRARLATASFNEGKSMLVDDVARLIAAVVIEIVEDQLKQLGLSPVRRLPLRPQDHAKAELHASSSVFVPMPVSSAHYFVAKITDSGVAYELLKLARVPFENGAMRMTVGDRLPIKMADFLSRREARAVIVGATGLEVTDGLVGKTSSSYVVNKRDLKDMFLYCNALVAQTTVEQQLKDRKIPYEHRYPTATSTPRIGSPKTTAGEQVASVLANSRSPLVGMIPELSVNTRDLLKDGRAAEVAEPKVSLVIKDWWLGGKCSVETVVRLAHTSSVSPSTTTAPGASPAVASSSLAARAEGIAFDHTTSRVSFHSRDIARCVPEFLEQWERISKVIVVAGEVNRLHRMDQFKDLRMLAFDLRTATLQYSPGYIVAITYTPTSDSYEASFSRSSPSSQAPGNAFTSTSTATPVSTGGINGHALTPARDGPDGESAPSPHECIAPLLSHRLNQLTVAGAGGGKKKSAGRQFIQLLRSTLPFLLEVETLKTGQPFGSPALVVRSATEYRLVWDVDNAKRYAIDATLTPSYDQFLLTDASIPQPSGLIDYTCGPLTPIPNLESAINKAYQIAKMFKVETFCPTDRTVEQFMFAAKLDGGKSLLVRVGVVSEVLSGLAREVWSGIEAARKG